MTRERQSSTNHFSVTWPRCTFFILNPTVGIELMDTDISRNASQNIFRSISADQGHPYSIVNSPPWLASVRRHSHTKHWAAGVLTARTLSIDVLPAFCSPSMVTSISEALYAPHVRPACKNWTIMSCRGRPAETALSAWSDEPCSSAEWRM
jgi:hypothetical protein